MKKMILAMAVISAATSAHAARISFQEIAQAEVTYVQNHKTVKALVAKLGAQDFQLAEGRNNNYKVITNNGCAFNARVAYGSFGYNPSTPTKGFDNVYVSKAVCN